MALPVRVLEHRPSAVRWLPQAEPVVSTPASQATADLSRLPRGHRYHFVRQMVPTRRTRRCTDADDTPAAPAGTDADDPPAAPAATGAAPPAADDSPAAPAGTDAAKPTTPANCGLSSRRSWSGVNPG